MPAIRRRLVRLAPRRAWKDFEPFFTQGPHWAQSLIESDMNVPRRVVAHMNPLAENDIKDLESAFRRWVKHVKAIEDKLPEDVLPASRADRQRGRDSAGGSRAGALPVLRDLLAWAAREEADPGHRARPPPETPCVLSRDESSDRQWRRLHEPVCLVA
jgi:hypothetical protein